MAKKEKVESGMKLLKKPVVRIIITKILKIWHLKLATCNKDLK